VGLPVFRAGWLGGRGILRPSLALPPRALPRIPGGHEVLGGRGLLQSPAKHLHPISLAPPEDTQVEAGLSPPTSIPATPAKPCPCGTLGLQECPFSPGFHLQVHPHLPSSAAPAPCEVSRGQAHWPSRAPESRYWLHLPRRDQREYWGPRPQGAGLRAKRSCPHFSCACRCFLGVRLRSPSTPWRPGAN
jgi:hypothetical protein